MAELERMWAPWRMEMIRAPHCKDEGCFLCTKPAQDKDRENLVLERGETCYCLMNLYPYNNCHLMVVPYRHSGEIMDLTPQELAELMRLAQRWIAIIRKAARPEGVEALEELVARAVGVRLGVEHREQALARIAAQMDEQKRLSFADRVVVADDRHLLIPQVVELHGALCGWRARI